MPKKIYCNSNLDNSVPGNKHQSIKDKFNKSTFFEAKPFSKSNLEIKNSRFNRSRKTGMHIPECSKNAQLKYHINKTSKLNFSQDQRVKKKGLKKIRKTWNHEAVGSTRGLKQKGDFERPMEEINKDFFSVTSEVDKGKLIGEKSTSSIGTHMSIYSHNRQKKEFNLYCKDDSTPTNNSGSQGEIIYRRKKKKMSHKAQNTNTNRYFFPNQKSKTVNLKSILNDKDFSNQN